MSLIAALVLLSISTSLGSEQVGSEEIGASDVVLFVVSQRSTLYHRQRAELFRQHIAAQLPTVGAALEVVFNYDDSISGSLFIITPFLFRYREKLANKKWVVICQDETRVNLVGLMKTLSLYKYEALHFLGHALVDEEMTIRHHFAQPKLLAFPDMYAGYAMTTALVERLLNHIDSLEKYSMEFRIDTQYELAQLVWNGLGVRLVNVTGFCAIVGQQQNQEKEDGGDNAEECFTWISESARFPACAVDQKTNLTDLFFAVKSTKKYFDNRIPFLKKTWAQPSLKIIYFAEEDNASIPAVSLGVPNTESGHCEKLKRILAYFLANRSEPWLVVADDDTLISVPRLVHLLDCFQREHSLALGERYGYQTWVGGGYPYITGGGGFALARDTVASLVEVAHCGKPDDPDDMMLGQWLSSVGVAITHCNLFHQARPYDYPSTQLRRELSVSFHKFWACDPLAVYRDWLWEPEIETLAAGLADTVTTTHTDHQHSDL